MQSRVSIAELIDSDVFLRPEDAVAIFSDICRQYTEGLLRGIPNAAVIRLTPDGDVVVEGPVCRDHAGVPAAAHLLTEMLPGFDSHQSGFKVPGGLRLVLARATGSIDLPPFADVEAFRAALQRFAAPDLAGTVRGLFQAWAARQTPRDPADAPRELTISDVRRARRATGLSLEDVSRGADIPAGTLRELEWGYVRNWRANDQGREALRRYARAAGLDEDLVVSIAWPLIEREHAAAASVDEDEWGLVPTGSQALVPVPQPSAPSPSPSPALGPYRWVAALAAAVLLVITVFATGPEQPLAAPPMPPATRGPVTPLPAAPAPDIRANPAVRSASYVRPAVRPTPRKAPPRKSAKRPAPRKPSFFKRELFRIVIR
jgi:hypothetical protein